MLRRQAQASQLDFRQNWRTYASGFGEPNGEYWIGNVRFTWLELASLPQNKLHFVFLLMASQKQKKQCNLLSHPPGLETLHQLTKDSTYALRVDMTWEDEEATSLYDSFR